MVNHNSEWKEQMEYYGVLSDAQEVFADADEDDNREQLSDHPGYDSGRE